LQKIGDSGETTASREASFDEEVEDDEAHLPVAAICLRRPESMALDGGAHLGFRYCDAFLEREQQRERGGNIWARGGGAPWPSSCTRGRGREREGRAGARSRASSVATEEGGRRPCWFPGKPPVHFCSFLFQSFLLFLFNFLFSYLNTAENN